ncbi:hypothetical protein [Thiocystis violacea]|uniref:hypothetical protein n=1 Tax=Thiocystis violacea TaxID=13725 RepID=UPI001907162A|nr:hypothetical protein [Thiocystis violacea]MBK1722596.1 hypothetical protein [Thiocystis violacea]
MLTLSGKIVGLSKAEGKVTIEGTKATRTLDEQAPTLLDGVKVGDGVVARFRNEILGEVKSSRRQSDRLLAHEKLGCFSPLTSTT